MAADVFLAFELRFCKILLVSSLEDFLIRWLVVLVLGFEVFLVCDTKSEVGYHINSSSEVSLNLILVEVGGIRQVGGI